MTLDWVRIRKESSCAQLTKRHGEVVCAVDRVAAWRSAGARADLIGEVRPGWDQHGRSAGEGVEAGEGVVSAVSLRGST